MEDKFTSPIFGLRRMDINTFLFLFLLAISITLINCGGSRKAITQENQENKDIAGTALKEETGKTNTGASTNPASNRLLKEIKNSSTQSDSFIDSLRMGFIEKLDREHYSYLLIDSVPPILTKVFPGVSFYTERIGGVTPYIGIGAYFNGNNYGPVVDFNQLYSLTQKESTCSFEEKVESLILLYHEYGIQLELQSITPKKIDVWETFVYSDKLNYEVRALINGEPVTHYIFFENNQFKCICMSTNNNVHEIVWIQTN